MARPLPEGLREWFAERLEGERTVEARCLVGAETGEPTFLIRADVAAANDIRLDLAQAERDGSRMLRQSLDAGFDALLGEEQEMN